jgi:amino acid permease
MIVYILFLIFHMLLLLLNVYRDDDEGMSFMTFVRRSLYPKGNNALKDEGL